MTLNGSLAGLVAVTAGCDMVNPFGAACIGLIAGFVVVFGIEFIDKKLKIDDPVGAIGVHGLCGATGTLLTGLFATDGGAFYGGGFSFFGVQALGVVSVIAWVTVMMVIIYTLIKKPSACACPRPRRSPAWILPSTAWPAATPILCPPTALSARARR